jgi:dihydrodipicolinate synthase/N-acetylneuraminate lyase
LARRERRFGRPGAQQNGYTLPGIDGHVWLAVSIEVGCRGAIALAGEWRPHAILEVAFALVQQHRDRTCALHHQIDQAWASQMGRNQVAGAKSPSGDLYRVKHGRFEFAVPFAQRHIDI